MIYRNENTGATISTEVPMGGAWKEVKPAKAKAEKAEPEKKKGSKKK